MSKEEYKSLINEFYRSYWLAWLTTLITGFFLLFPVWYIKGSEIFYGEINIGIIWNIIAYMIAFTIIGFIFCVVIGSMIEAYNIHKFLIILSIVILIYNAIFLFGFIESEKKAANDFKNLLIEQQEHLEKEHKEELQHRIDEIDQERNAWKEINDYYD